MIYPWHAEYLDRVGLKIITPPTSEQITLEQARLHLRIDAYNSPPEHADDQWILDNIPSAREWCEDFTGRALAPQTLELAIGRFPGTLDGYGTLLSPGPTIQLPMSPVTGITSLTYLDSAGVTQTIAASNYALDSYSQPPRLYGAYGTSWPSTQSIQNAVVVRYTAGYSIPGDSPQDFPLPASIRSAMLLVLGHLYENRENSADVKMEEIPLGAQSLLGGRNRVELGFA